MAPPFRRILVPVADNPESVRAVDAACRLAAEHGASLTALTVVEVPALLPLDAHMLDEEAAAHTLLRQAEAIADEHGVRASARTLRARTAAGAIVDRATSMNADLVVMSAARRRNVSSRTPIFGRTVNEVLENAPCRVLVFSRPYSSQGRMLSETSAWAASAGA
ncbi:MAG TPA: universal stress protein [Gaiellaceae bacterium]|nr:universal stress protein [Gaiellaceae bacterium]